jgi:predicted ATP-dependent serine protease
MPPSDRVEWAKTIPDMSKFEDGLLDIGCSLSDIDALLTELEFYRKTENPGAAADLIQALADALNRPRENSAVDPLVTISEKPKPRFPSGITELDTLTAGGGYGLTTIVGDAKAGKTMCAIALAVESALAGWRVIYINAELDRNEAIMAVMRCGGGEIPEAVRENMTLVSPDFTFTPNDAITRIAEAVQLDDERILVVLDSINALVDLSSDGEGRELDFWTANSMWRNFAVRSTRKTFGRVAFAVVSETNRDGEVKGRALAFKSDLVVRISKDKEDSSMVEIDVTHSRSTPAGQLGLFKRDWLNGRFVRCE